MLRSRRLATLAVAALAGAGPLAVLAATGFDGLYGQDSYAYYEYGVGALRDSIASWSLPPPFFWPPGFPFLLALVSFVTGPEPIAGQLVALACAATVPVLTLLLAVELLQPGPAERDSRVPRAAMIAGVFAALSGQLWQSGMVVMSDTPALAAGTLSMLFLAKFLNRQQRRLLVAAAACWGAAIAIRWGYALLLAPWLAALWSSGAPAAEQAKRLALAAIVVLALLAPQVTIALAHQSRGTTSGTPAFAGNLTIYRWHPLNAARRQFVTSDGVLDYRLPNGIYYATAPARPAFLTPIGAALALAGLSLAVRQRHRLLLAIAGCWMLVMVAFHSGAAWQNFRFTLAYLPPLAIFAGVGADWLLGYTNDRVRLARLVALVVFAVMAAAAIRTCVLFVERVNQDVEVVRWTEQQMPPSGVLVTFQLTAAFRHRSRLELRELYSETPASLANLVAAGGPVYLLVDASSIEQQWRDEPPGENVGWLRVHAGLTRLGDRGAYTLYRVGP